MRLGGGLFGLGAGTPSRFPYPGRPQPSPGVAPSPGSVIRARVVIVSGPNGGIFLYSGTPAAGNPPIASITTATADPFGNPVKKYITVYGTNGSAVQLQPGAAAVTNFYTGDAAESVPSFIGTNVVGSGATRHLQTVLESAFLAGQAAGTGASIELASFSPDLMTVSPAVNLIVNDGVHESFVVVTPASVSIRGQLFFVSPSNDLTGAADSAAISAVFTAGWSVQLLPGATYYLKTPLTVPAGSYLDLGAATVQPGSAWSQPVGTPMITVNSGCTFGGGTLYGGTNTRSSNPPCDAVSVAAGATRFHILPYTCNYMNGYVLNPGTITAAAHGTVGQLLGTNNAGGMLLAAASAAGISAQYSIGQVNLQQCEVNEAISLQHVFDVTIADYNCSVLGTAGVPTVHLAGKCTTCILIGTNAGVQGAATAGVPVLHVEDLGGASVTDCKFLGSTFQQGGHGVVVDGGTARCQWIGVTAKGNAGDGFQFNGTGTALYVGGCYGNTNTGTADVNVTSTAHVGLDHFAYCSAGTTDSLSVVAGNHVSNDNPTSPGGRPVAGAPAGW